MQNPNEKQIRFIDSSYNDLFTVGDGGTVYLTYENGEKAERVCKYIDQTHFSMGGHTWHICEFAERMEQNKTKYAPFEMPSNMPYRCYSVSKVSGELVILKYGVDGYFKCNANTHDKNRNLEIAQKVNESFGITKAQAEAMYAGSMFGFHTLLAKPENYEENSNAKVLTIGECYTTEGNWAGFPPHKHDEDNMPVECICEEIYYFLYNPKQGFGVQLLYTADGELDEAYRVKNDELVEFPYGYHSTVSTPGYETYFLWLMAGDYQGFNRSNDPIHDWIK